MLDFSSDFRGVARPDRRGRFQLLLPEPAHNDKCLHWGKLFSDAVTRLQNDINDCGVQMPSKVPILGVSKCRKILRPTSLLTPHALAIVYKHLLTCSCFDDCLPL